MFLPASRNALAYDNELALLLSPHSGYLDNLANHQNDRMVSFFPFLLRDGNMDYESKYDRYRWVFQAIVVFMRLAEESLIR